MAVVHGGAVNEGRRSVVWQRGASQGNAMGLVDQAVEPRVGRGGVADATVVAVTRTSTWWRTSV